MPQAGEENLFLSTHSLRCFPDVIRGAREMLRGEKLLAVAEGKKKTPHFLSRLESATHQYKFVTMLTQVSPF